ncbi:MAG TPA: patatin-like phospholipase family protein [Luteimonas sp.]|nr:patatin-like phospholipase family protein [Luteimonas sp.]
MKPLDVELERVRAEGDDEQPPAKPGGLALCLSGGGYRAALFHLGALLRLHQTGLLHEAELISAVSGGSILSGWLATRYLATRQSAAESFDQWCGRINFTAVVVESFRTFVSRDIRTWPVLRTLPYNWLWPSHRVRLLERAYAKQFGSVAIPDLPDRPAFVFCATDLTFGVNWIFSKRRVGDYMAGYLRQPGRIPLSEAVAASSSFPPVFGPVRFDRPGGFSRGKYSGRDADRLRSHIDLSDGGVYDNLAMEPSLRNYSTVLISDAGAPFGFQTRRWYFRRLLRYTEVIGNQARSLRKRIYYTFRSHGGFDGTLWGLTGPFVPKPSGYAPDLVEDTIGRIRTDLDRFLEAEFDILVNHGYFTCNDALVAKGLVPASAPAAVWPFPKLAGPAAVRRALRGSDARIFHGRWFSRR